jgi:hypothetical protein
VVTLPTHATELEKQMNKAIVIIPTTGAPELECAIASVMNQSVPTDVLVVFDGKSFDRDIDLPRDDRVSKIVLPFNTGNGRTGTIHKDLPRHWYGSREMTAAAYLINNDYVMVLDQDNWLREDHVERCLEKLEPSAHSGSQLVYCLRNIYSKDGEFVCRDECESLGKRSGISGLLIDTSCYFYRSDFLMHTAHLWLWGWGSDRVYLQRLLRNFGDQLLGETGRYTLNYRLGGNDGSVKAGLFIEGNRQAHMRYGNGVMPWAVE